MRVYGEPSWWDAVRRWARMDPRPAMCDALRTRLLTDRVDQLNVWYPAYVRWLLARVR